MTDGSYQPTDRRPIAARRWRIWTSVVKWLVRRGVSANSISVAGMVGGIFAGLAFVGTHSTVFAWLLAAIFIQLRLLANLLDGMVAIESGKASPVGEMYNEVPDRVSDSATLIGAGYAVASDPTFGYLAACAALFTAYARAMGKAAGAPNEYCGPMAKQQRMALLTIAAIYVGLAPAAWQPQYAERGIITAALLVIAVGSIITSLRRLLRIAANLRSKPR